MKATRLSALALAVAALATVAMPAQAQRHWGGGGYHGSYRGGGWWGPGLLLGGIGLGVALSSRPYYDSYYGPAYYGPSYYGPSYYGPAYYGGYSYAPRYVVAAPPTVVYDSGPVVQATVSQPVPVTRTSTVPEPIVYPKNGQSANQTEADRQACNRWATSQPQAMGDASIFQRATLACLEGRGYTVK